MSRSKPPIKQPTTSVDPAGRECTLCMEYKLWEAYNPKKGSRTGFAARCKICQGKNPLPNYGHFDVYGYLRIPFRGKKHFYKHRAVMEIMLGRELCSWESVHHMNGIKTDNNYSNLELWVTPQKPGQRVSDLVSWIITNYPSDVRKALELVS